MTMAEFQMLSDYWADHPPVHLLAAGYLGVKPKRRTKAQSARRQTPQEMLALLKDIPGFTVH